MTIWFYLFLIAGLILIYFIIKNHIIKSELKNINKKLPKIIKDDTNNILTISSNNKALKELVINLNQSLKELRKLELEYRQGNNELKASITNISHDLRTPLTAIRGYLDLINTKNLSSKEKEYLKIIDNKAKDLTDLIEELFAFSKSIDLSHEIKKERVCLNNILENTIVSFYSLFKEKNIKPKIEICSEKIYRTLSEIMLKRIFENIISNALKYSENDFTIKLKKDGRIIFSNQTKLLDKTSLEKMFDRYYTVRNAKKSNGIGLSIAKQLVKLNNGTISAEYKNNHLIITIKFSN